MTLSTSNSAFHTCKPGHVKVGLLVLLIIVDPLAPISLNLVALRLSLVQERPERTHFFFEDDDLNVAAARADETVRRLDGASKDHGERMGGPCSGG